MSEQFKQIVYTVLRVFFGVILASLIAEFESRVLGQEMASVHLRPALTGFGLSMIGPLLLQEGSEELKHRHLPPIVRGEIRWCQGYSEPGAGSDNSGMTTCIRKEKNGKYILNGSKCFITNTSFASQFTVVCKVGKPTSQLLACVIVLFSGRLLLRPQFPLVGERRSAALLDWMRRSTCSIFCSSPTPCKAISASRSLSHSRALRR